MSTLRGQYNNTTMVFSNPSPQLSAVQLFFDAITTWKFSVVEELFSDDYKHTTLPTTANQPPKTKAQGIAHAKAVAAALGNAPLKVMCWILSRHIRHTAFTERSDVLFRAHSTRSFNITRVREASGSTYVAPLAGHALCLGYKEHSY